MIMQQQPQQQLTLEDVYAAFDESIQSLRTLSSLRSSNVATALSKDPLAHRLFEAIDRLEIRVKGARSSLNEAADAFQGGLEVAKVSNEHQMEARLTTSKQITDHLLVTRAALNDMVERFACFFKTTFSYEFTHL